MKFVQQFIITFIGVLLFDRQIKHFWSLNEY